MTNREELVKRIANLAIRALMGGTLAGEEPAKLVQVFAEQVADLVDSPIKNFKDLPEEVKKQIVWTRFASLIQ